MCAPPVAGLVAGCFPSMAGGAEPATVGGVVGVHPGGFELPAGQGVVVGDCGGVAAEDACRLRSQHLIPERTPVCCTVTALC